MGETATAIPTVTTVPATVASKVMSCWAPVPTRSMSAVSTWVRSAARCREKNTHDDEAMASYRRRRNDALNPYCRSAALTADARRSKASATPTRT